jgi:hypothetical protein
MKHKKIGFCNRSVNVFTESGYNGYPKTYEVYVFAVVKIPLSSRCHGYYKSCGFCALIVPPPQVEGK